MTFFGTLHLIIVIGVIVLLAVITFDFVRRFRKATGSFGDRVLAAGRGTETLVVARVTQFFGSLAVLAIGVTDYLNLPTVSEKIKELLTSYPMANALFVVLLAVLVEWARKRKADDLK